MLVFSYICLGYSFNIFTLLALVLAVGLVVDDAIVVLENSYRYIKKGFTAEESAKKGSSEIGFAVVGMTICLIAVYLPVVLLKGKTAVYFQEFALTIAGAIFISGFVSLTLSPVMCRFLLAHNNKKSKNIKENKYQLWLDKVTLISQNYYEKVLNQVIRFKFIMVAVFFVFIIMGVYLFKKITNGNYANRPRWCRIILFVRF